MPTCSQKGAFIPQSSLPVFQKLHNSQWVCFTLPQVSLCNDIISCYANKDIWILVTSSVDISSPSASLLPASSGLWCPLDTHGTLWGQGPMRHLCFPRAARVPLCHMFRPIAGQLLFCFGSLALTQHDFVLYLGKDSHPVNPSCFCFSLVIRKATITLQQTLVLLPQLISSFSLRAGNSSAFTG